MKPNMMRIMASDSDDQPFLNHSEVPLFGRIIDHNYNIYQSVINYQLSLLNNNQPW